jgi:hypothetical protein
MENTPFEGWGNYHFYKLKDKRYILALFINNEESGIKAYKYLVSCDNLIILIVKRDDEYIDISLCSVPDRNIYATIEGLHKQDYIKDFVSSVDEMEPFEVRIALFGEDYEPLFFRPKAPPILALGYVYKSPNDIQNFLAKLN